MLKNDKPKNSPKIPPIETKTKVVKKEFVIDLSNYWNLLIRSNNVLDTVRL